MERTLTGTAAPILVFLLIAVAAAPASGQHAVPRGAAIYIEEMDNDLDGYLRAEMNKQKLPLRVVLSREDAHLVLTGTSTAEQKRAWHQGWLTADQDRTSGNVMVFDRASKSLLWAGEAGDRSLWWGAMARGGQRKVASRLVGSLKKSISKHAVTLEAPPPLAAEERAAPLLDGESPAPGAPAGRSAAVTLRNADVLKMVRAGLGDVVIVQAIDRAVCEFDVTPDALVRLKQEGASDAVISAMLRRTQ